jgi:hypothetical protein
MRTIARIVNYRGGIEPLKLAPIKLTVEGFMPLVIEYLGRGPRGQSLLSVAHYFQHPSGDLIADPDLEVEVLAGPDGTLPEDVRAWEPVAIQHSTGQYNRACWVDDEGRVRLNLREISDIRSFMRFWSRNLEEQGFLAAAKAN